MLSVRLHSVIVYIGLVTYITACLHSERKMVYIETVDNNCGGLIETI